MTTTIPRMFAFDAATYGIKINRTERTFQRSLMGSGTFPAEPMLLAGATAEFVNGDASSRFTATRLALFGPLGLGLRKRTGHNHIVFTTADGQQAMVDVDPNHTITAGARRFVIQFNNLARSLAQENP